MPDLPEHLDQSNHNALFSAVFPQDQYADWAITARFYAAAHLIRAWLKRFPDVTDTKIDTHTKVENLLTQKRFDLRKHRAYRDLVTLSRDARYGCFPVTDLSVDVADAQARYEELRDFILPTLASYLPSQSTAS